MSINVRTKGQTGEREVAMILQNIINDVRKELGTAAPILQTVQRNQNQSAVGGCDLINTFGLAIEVKRQEQLSVKTWWKQCVKSADERNEVPVLIYRQNRKPWRVMLIGWLPRSHVKLSHLNAPIEVDMETFKLWVQGWILGRIMDGKYD